jgi:ElaA protein
VTTGENTRSEGTERGWAPPSEPLPWESDEDLAVFEGGALGVGPQVCRGRSRDLSPLVALALARLRVDVLVVEAGSAHAELDELDADPATQHFWIEDGGLAVACVRLVTEPDGTRCIDRACSRRDVRGLGLVGALVTDVVARHGGGPLRALGRPSTLPYFLRQGFEISGPTVVAGGERCTPLVRRPEAPWR